MKRIKIIKNGVQTNGAELADDKYQAWIDTQVSLGSWGRPERWIQEVISTSEITGAVSSNLSDAEKALALEMREGVRPLDGTPYKEYRFAADYQIVIEDMAAEIADQLTKADKRAQRIEQLKTLAAKTSLTNAELQGVALALIKQVLSLD
jgi:hypothetical protein